MKKIKNISTKEYNEVLKIIKYAYDHYGYHLHSNLGIKY